MAKAEKNASKPNYAVPPGKTLRETLQSLGMTQAELAQRSGRPKKTINEITSSYEVHPKQVSLFFCQLLSLLATLGKYFLANFYRHPGIS